MAIYKDPLSGVQNAFNVLVFSRLMCFRLVVSCTHFPSQPALSICTFPPPTPLSVAFPSLPCCCCCYGWGVCYGWGAAVYHLHFFICCPTLCALGIYILKSAFLLHCQKQMTLQGWQQETSRCLCSCLQKLIGD